MKLKKHLAQGNIIYFHASGQQLSVAENAHYRWLCLNDIVQSVMLKRQPWQLTLPHQLAIVLPLQFFTPKSILEIGLGGGALNRYIKHLIPNCDFTCLELNNEVVTCFNRLFDPNNSKPVIINDDAETWLTTQPTLIYDWIVIDIFLSIEDSVISYQLIDDLLNKTQYKALITLNLPNEKEQQIDILLKRLKLIANIQVVYFNVPHYKNIVLHIIPAKKAHQFADKVQSPLKTYQQRRWQHLWQQGIHL